MNPLTAFKNVLPAKIMSALSDMWQKPETGILWHVHPGKTPVRQTLKRKPETEIK